MSEARAMPCFIEQTTPGKNEAVGQATPDCVCEVVMYHTTLSGLAHNRQWHTTIHTHAHNIYIYNIVMRSYIVKGARLVFFHHLMKPVSTLLSSRPRRLFYNCFLSSFGSSDRILLQIILDSVLQTFSVSN